MSVVFSSIADVLMDQFGDSVKANRWMNAHGTFCSQYSEAVSVYKDLMKTDSRFQKFVWKCRDNPELNKMSIPDCLLSVTTRITKYPVIVEAMIKTVKERPEEQQRLRNCLQHIKNIIVNVNRQVGSFKHYIQRLIISFFNLLDC